MAARSISQVGFAELTFWVRMDHIWSIGLLKETIFPGAKGLKLIDQEQSISIETINYLFGKKEIRIVLSNKIFLN